MTFLPHLVVDAMAGGKAGSVFRKRAPPGLAISESYYL
jgi:hypothetical protein